MDQNELVDTLKFPSRRFTVTEHRGFKKMDESKQTKEQKAKRYEEHLVEMRKRQDALTRKALRANPDIGITVPDELRDEVLAYAERYNLSPKDAVAMMLLDCLEKEGK
jgi:predicted DNA-binding transcriptional regulator YafY